MVFSIVAFCLLFLLHIWVYITCIMAKEKNKALWHQYPNCCLLVYYFGFQIHIRKHLQMLTVVFLVVTQKISSVCSALCVMILWYFYGILVTCSYYKRTERLFPAFDWLDMHCLVVSHKNEFLFLGKMGNHITLGRIASCTGHLYVFKSADNMTL